MRFVLKKIDFVYIYKIHKIDTKTKIKQRILIDSRTTKRRKKTVGHTYPFAYFLFWFWFYWWFVALFMRFAFKVNVIVLNGVKLANNLWIFIQFYWPAQTQIKMKNVYIKRIYAKNKKIKIIGCMNYWRVRERWGKKEGKMIKLGTLFKSNWICGFSTFIIRKLLFIRDIAEHLKSFLMPNYGCVHSSVSVKHHKRSTQSDWSSILNALMLSATKKAKKTKEENKIHTNLKWIRKWIPDYDYFFFVRLTSFLRMEWYDDDDRHQP